MRSRKKFSVHARQVHEHAATLLQEHLRLKDHGWNCRASLLISVLLFAASRIMSLFDACQRLAGAPPQRQRLLELSVPSNGVAGVS